MARSIPGWDAALNRTPEGIKLCQIAKGKEADIDGAVKSARNAFDGNWGRTPAAERGRILARLGQLVLGQVEFLAHLEALDVGKPLKQARADVIALARYMEFYGGAADKVHGETIPTLKATPFILFAKHTA